VDISGSYGLKKQAERRICRGAGRTPIITRSNARLGNLISCVVMYKGGEIYGVRDVHDLDTAVVT
jgi:hypothetical protein